jgi:glycosyltransferase involved in cell wall biosynthesis
VLQVVLSLNPGGTERLVIEMARRLHPTLPTAVCCLDEAGAWAREVESEGITVSALHRGPGFRPSLGRGVALAARRHGATVLHAHHYSPFVYSCLARVISRAAVIFTEHGRLSDAPPSSKRRIANRVLAAFPHAVYAVSDDVRQHLVGEGFAAKSVGVIYNGIDVGPLPAPAVRAEVRRELGASEDTLVLGTIARLDPVKDLDTLLTAAADVARHRPLAVVVIGDGAERARLEARARALGIERHVRWLGHREDARRWLAGCDAYVNSSISEGVSLTILEAMAAGLAIVATRVGGTPEVLDETCARLVPSRDPSRLVEALAGLGADPALRAALGRAARQRVEQRFTLDRMVREYEEVYRRATNDRMP